MDVRIRPIVVLPGLHARLDLEVSWEATPVAVRPTVGAKVP